mmetsp:Transcript_11855/g.14103  ORF Transcript_11855/g.14103 Transcript_11855/m.14103 type:complete len:86 (+) Transcript_11855:375-632(+)
MPPKKGGLRKQQRAGWSLTNIVQEDHAQPIYSISYNFCDLRYKDVFATAGANRATVYECQPDGVIDLILAFVDEDVSGSFFSVCI